MSACVSGCTIRGEHLAECDGTALGRDGELMECRGCLPRPAEVGVLCPWCWGRLQSLVRTMPSLVDHLLEMAEPALSSPMGRADGGGTSARPGERSLYPAAMAEVDELHAMLATWAGEVAAERPGAGLPPAVSRLTVPDADGVREPLGPASAGSTRRLVGWLAQHLEWVASQPWAGDMLTDLASATHRATRAFPVEAAPRRSEDVRCPSCGSRSLVVEPPSVFGADVFVRCRVPACGLVMTEEDWEHTRERAVVVARSEMVSVESA